MFQVKLSIEAITSSLKFKAHLKYIEIFFPLTMQKVKIIIELERLIAGQEHGRFRKTIHPLSDIIKLKGSECL